MNSCWQVVRTYLTRWRFWIFGGLYAWVALWVLPTYWAPPQQRQYQATVVMGLLLSMIFASVVGCLASLHLRRLLSGPAAHAVPGFWGPHLLVGAVVSLAIWVALPWAQADLAGISRLRVIALHSLAGTLSAVVLLWPRAIFLLGVLPASMVWVATERPGSALLVRSFNGEAPIVSIAAIVLAVAAYPIAALILWRTRDRTAIFSDDLVLDRSHQRTTPWKEGLLRLRDAAIEWHIGRAGGFAWRFRRWQTPCATSWTELGLLFLMLIAVMAVTGFAVGQPDAAFPVALMASILALFIPLGSWRFRCTALAGECTRPIAREQFVRQFITAMLCDFLRWTVVATLIGVLGYVVLAVKNPQDAAAMFRVHIVFLWTAAALLYGIALATIRMRYWLPWFLGLSFASIFVVGYSLITLVGWLNEYTLLEEALARDMLFVLYVAAYAGIGLFFIWLTYRRWLRMEIT